VTSTDFNVFQVRDLSKGNELVVTVMHMFNLSNLWTELNLNQETVYKFLTQIQATYYILTYHNKTHATDLSQTFFSYLHSCGLKELCKVTKKEEFSFIISGAIHDYKHPGFNNAYFIETQDPLAIKFNGKP
jgi:hypothetical protein